MVSLDNKREPTFSEKFPEFKHFHEEDGLLFWNGYLVSTSVSELTSDKLTEMENICQMLINRGLNPEEIFNFNPIN